MKIQSVVCAFLLFVISSGHGMAASFANRIGTGIQFGGAIGLQESYVFGRGLNGVRFSAGYTGFALGYDRYVGAKYSLGIQGFLNQYRAGYAISLNHYFNTHRKSGWLIGLDFYYGVDTETAALEFFTSFLLTPGDFGINVDPEPGAFIAIGYQF